MTQEQRPKASFGRVVGTPIILLIAAFLVGMVIPDSMIPAIAIAAVISIGYVLWASRR